MFDHIAGSGLLLQTALRSLKPLRPPVNMDGGVPAEMRQLMTDLMRDASVQAMRQQRPGAIPADSAGQAPSYEDQLRRKHREKRQQLYQLYSGMSVAAAMDYGSGNTKPSRAACSAEAVDCTAVTRRRLPGLLPGERQALLEG